MRYDRNKFRSRAQLQMIPAEEPRLAPTISIDAVKSFTKYLLIPYLLAVKVEGARMLCVALVVL